MMRRRLLPAAAALLLLSCKDASGPSGPVSIVLSTTAVTFDAIGATRPVVATVQAEGGRELTGAAATWSSSSDAVVTVTPSTTNSRSAQLRAVSNGTAMVTVRSGNVTETMSVEVAQLPSTLAKTGDAQEGRAGAVLAAELRLLVRDRLGQLIVGVPVSFSVQGGGVLSATVAATNAQGIASTAWTLGTSTSTPQLVTATAGALTTSYTAIARAGPAVSITKVAGDDQVAQAGARVPINPSVRVADEYDNPVTGAVVSFVPASGSGTVGTEGHFTNASGVAAVDRWTLGWPEGPMSLLVTVNGLMAAPVVFRATATPGPEPAVIELVAGGWQAGVVGTAVPTRPTVRVRNAEGQPMPGKTVTFVVSNGGGTLTDPVVTSDALGIAAVGEWTLGAVAEMQHLTATVNEGFESVQHVSFAATACTASPQTGFGINVCFLTPVTSTERATFAEAAARWSSIITGDLPSIRMDREFPQCGPNAPALNLLIDDVLIFARIEPIDGVGGVLGSAGPCYIRTAGSLPLVGTMRFDIADVQNLQSSGRFRDVILHEMGHVLGIGTLWSHLGFLQNPSPVGGPPLDTHFNGANAIQGFDMIGGLTYVGGAKVPVENTMGAGSINSHWRESVLGTELMTPLLSTGVPNPLTVLTVRSLQDLGYSVDQAGADAQVVHQLHAEEPGIRIHMGDDVHRGPLHRVDRRGRIERIR